MNRPILWAALAFTAGIGMASLAAQPLPWIGLAALVLLLLASLPHRIPMRDGFLVAFVFFMAGAAVETYHRPARQGDALSEYTRRHPETIYTLEGTVRDAPVFTPGVDYMSVRIDVDAVWISQTAMPLTGRVVVRWSDPNQALHPGERIRVDGRLDPALGEVNIGHRGVEDYYRTHGYHSTLRTRGDRLQKVSSPRAGIRYAASLLRHREARLLARTVPPEIQPFIRAVWLGDRANLPYEAYQPFLQTGAAHILAVSGVHIGILYLSLHLLLRTFIQHRKARTVLILAVVVLFALVTGCRTPILRATIMLSLYLAADLLDREPDAPTALSIAALLFLVWNPGLLRDTGFVLSFGSLASILLFSQALGDRMTLLPMTLRQNVAATLGVSVLPLPLGTHFFHVIPLIGPLCNLLVIPLLTAVLWLCLFVVLIAPLSVPAASLFGHALAPIVHAINHIVSVASKLPGAYLTVTSPTLPALASYGVAVLGLARWLQNPATSRRWAMVTVGALVLTWACWRPLHQPATLDFLDVGHGDATFIRTPGGSTLLVDAGNKTDYVDMGSRVVVPWLLANGIDRLDYVIVTHPDQDHIGGIPAVLDTVDVGEVLLWPEATDDPTELALMAQCSALDIPVRRITAGETIIPPRPRGGKGDETTIPPRLRGGRGGNPAEETTITVLHPAQDTRLPGINNQSIVLRVTWPGLDALLTGDIEIEAERALLQQLGPVDILKAPHHGSHTSSSAAFLDVTAPRLAVISTRRTGQREATGRGVLPRYEERAIHVLRTDFLGGIQIRTRGDGYLVKSARRMRGYSLDPSDN